MNDLMQGISILYDMELNNYMMFRGIARLNYEINKLGRKREINEPKKYIANTGGNYILWGGFLGGVIGIVAYEVYFMLAYPASGIIDAIAKMVIGIFSWGFRGLIGGLIIGTIIEFVLAKPIEVAQGNKRFNLAMQEYYRQIDADDRRVANELEQRRILTEQRAILENRLSESEKLLQEFYDKTGIDRTYRNIVPIGYMNEFMRLGIATKLTGADGLYYLIRKELRMDQMQYSLAEISSKLDQIIDNQHAIHSELVRMNGICEKMVQSTIKVSGQLDKINQNTAVAAYNSERILQEQKYQNYFVTWNYIEQQ